MAASGSISRRPASRHIRRRKCDCTKTDAGRRVSPEINGRDLKQQHAKILRQRERCEKTQRHTGERDQSALSQDQPQDVAWPCSERHADSDFARTLRHRVCHDGIDTKRRQAARNQREEADQHRVVPRTRHRTGHEVLHRRHTVQCSRGVESPQKVAHVSRDRTRVGVHPNRK